MRNTHLLFDLKVNDPRNLVELATKLLGKATDGIEILAVDLQRDLGADPGEHVVQTMRDGLPDIRRNGKHGKPRSDIGDDLVF